MHGWREVCDLIVSSFFFFLTAAPPSLSVYHTTTNLCLLDFLQFLALGNELSGELVIAGCFVDNEGDV